MIGNINLYWGTRKLTDKYEDHLTEFLAALLVSDSAFREKYEETVLVAHATTLGWSSHAIAKVETQVAYADARCRPDMRLTTQGGHVVLCEHKIEAAETIGSETDPRPQLMRYLDMPADGLVYIRASWKPPDSDIIAHPKYIRPSHVQREHFLWSDFHPTLQAGTTPLAHWMRDAFHRLGFTPAHPMLGDLCSSSPDFGQQRENLFKLMEPIRSHAKALGWTPVKGTLADIWLQASPSPLLHTVRIAVSQNIVNIKIVPSSDDCLEQVMACVKKILQNEDLPVACEEDSCTLPDRKADAISLSISAADLLADADTVEQVQSAFRAYFCKYVTAVTETT